MLMLGESLQVPNVQELAKSKPATVPSRYVRSESDQIPVAFDGVFSSIPVIDFSKLCDTNHMDSELRLLHKACQEWGFFQLINHGVETEVIEKMKDEVQKFFNLPIDEKKAYCQKPGDVEGYGQAFVLSEEQKLDWGDMFFAISLPDHIRKPHLILMFPTDFRDATDSYSANLKILGTKIVEAMERALKLKVEEMSGLFKECLLSMRMNYYPPCPQPELVTGLSPHSDATALTILLEVNDTQGLQVMKDGDWIPVSPLPNAFIVNVGYIMEMITNGIYKSILHRASVNSDKERLSIATFMDPSLDVEFGPSPTLVAPETPARFRNSTTTEYLKGYLSRDLNGKSHFDAMRI